VDYPLLGRLYWKTIDKSLKRGAWVTSLNDVYEEWVTMSY